MAEIALQFLGAVVGAGLLAAGIGLTRERLNARRERRAELTALARDEHAPALTDDERRSVDWRASYSAALADLDARFDELLAGMPRAGDEPLPAGYWPSAAEGPEPEHVELETLAEFAPEVVLALVEEGNAAPAVFSWTTTELPILDTAGATR